MHTCVRTCAAPRPRRRPRLGWAGHRGTGSARCFWLGSDPAPAKWGPSPQGHRMPKGCPERPPGPWGSQAVSAEGARGLGSQRVPQDLRVCMVVKVRSGSRPPGGAICSAGLAMRPVPGLGLWGTGAGSPGGGRAGATPTSRPWRAARSLLSSLGLPLEGTFPALTRKARPFLGPPCCPPLWPGCGALWGAQSSVPSRGGRAPPPHIPSPFPPPVGGPSSRHSCGLCWQAGLLPRSVPTPSPARLLRTHLQGPRGPHLLQEALHRSLLALGPALQCASCPSQPSSQLPWAGGRWVPSCGLSCRSGWPPLQSHATQLSHLQSNRKSMSSGGSESLWAFRGKSKVPPNVGWQSPRSSALT